MAALAKNEVVAPFVWYELHSPDMAASTDFYTKVLPWTIADSGMPGMKYDLIHAGAHVVGGAMTAHSEGAPGTHQGWMGYVGVKGIETYVSRVVGAGGKVMKEVDDIPGVGRFAVVADPQGAYFTLFESLPTSEPTQPAPGTPGTFAWHDLTASDWSSDFDFYSQMFGWEKTESIDIGGGAIYQIFSINGAAAGGMMTRMNPSEAPTWLFYVNVEDCYATCEAAKSHGGKIVNEPMVVPGGQIVAQFTDPHGCKIGVVAPPAK